MKRLYYGLGRRKFIEYILFAVFILFFYGPLCNMLILAFAGEYEYPDVIPQTYGFKWWDYVLSRDNLLSSITTSFLVAVLATAISLAICLPAAYAISRIKFKGRKLVMFSFLLTNAFPKMGIYTAMAVVFYQLNLMGTLPGVLLVHIVNTMLFMTWIPAGAFRNVHQQQEEAARDAGAGPVRTFFQITLPMAFPGIAVAAIYTFLASLEESQGTMLIGLPNIKTMPVELYGIILDFPATFCAVFAIILLIPSIILLVLLRKYVGPDTLSKGLKLR